ncbi:MAG: CDP-glycerol glycerophosphotransferase family protein [Lentimicrobium sp.]
MTTAIVINREISKVEQLEIMRMIQGDPGSEVFTTSNIRLPFPVTVMVQDAEIKRSVNYGEMKCLLAFGETDLDGIPLSQRLSVNGLSLWHYHKYRIYFMLRNLAYEAEMALDFSNRFDKVLWFTDGPELQIHTALPDNISCQYPVSGVKKRKNFPAMVKYLIYLKIRFIQGLLHPYKPLKARHLILDRSIKQPCLDLKTLEVKPENYNLTYVFEKAGDDLAVIDELETPKFEKGRPFKFMKWMFANTRKPLKRIPGEYILLKAMFVPSVWHDFRKADKDFRAVLSSLNQEYSIGREAWILRRIRQFHPATRLYLFKYLAWRRFFIQNQYLSITSIDENSPAVRCILDAAKAFGIRTIGIQHGNIHDLHPAYLYTEADIRKGLLCDTTIVWGDYWKDFLINTAGYPADSLVVAGQSRTDIIPVLLREQQLLKTRLNLPTGEIIVFASQLQQDPLLRERAAFDVFESVKNLSDVHLIIKLHPSEASDPDYYVCIARQVGCENYSIAGGADLYMLIATCRLLITCFSTVGAEAVYFNKPLIILDHLEQDIQGYIRQKVAFKATNAGELSEIIKGVLSGKLKTDEEAGNDFIRRNAFRVDGQTSERILEIIRCSH